MIVPTGSPAWTRIAQVSDYGVVPDLHNLGDFGAVNAKTDITAEEYARLAADCLTAVRGAPLFWLTFEVGAGPVADVRQCQPMWDTASGPYSGATPPSSSFPTIIWDSGSSEFALTFPGLLSTVSAVRFIRARDPFSVAGDCVMSTPIVQTANAVSAATCRIVDGAELRIAGALVGATISLIVR
jgi:hypothetical protein